MKNSLLRVIVIAVAWSAALAGGCAQGLPVDMGGAGALISPINGSLMILETLPKMGAGKAGARPKDVITHIDGKDTASMKLEEALALLRGELGTEVVLTLKREGAPKPIPIIVERVPLSQYQAAREKQKERKRAKE
jgi:C-terminal processing protease CtpA/Prc